MMARDGLLEAYEATNAKHLLKPMYRDADGYWYGIYQGILGFMVNTDELTRMGLEAPRIGPICSRKSTRVSFGCPTTIPPVLPSWSSIP